MLNGLALRSGFEGAPKVRERYANRILPWGCLR